MTARKRKTKPPIPVGVPTPLPRPTVVYVVRDWHSTEGAYDCGFTFNQDIAITYIGKASPRGGRYYVGLRLEIGKLFEIKEPAS
jgi:hypothetical protein